MLSVYWVLKDADLFLAAMMRSFVFGWCGARSASGS